MSTGSGQEHANARVIGEPARRRAGRADRPRRAGDHIVVFHLGEGAPGAPEVVERARAQDVLVMAFGPRTVRAVTHLGVSRDDCALAADVLAAACAG